MPFQLGMIGLGTMGTNLARNAARNGANIAIFNRTTERVDDFMKEYGGEGTFLPAKSYESLAAQLDPPRAIILMVEASAVDKVINDLLPFLGNGDTIVDGGNSRYRDTERRARELAERGIRYIGMGVSGGKKGALEGPSLMIGGDKSAYDELGPLFQKMAASDFTGGKCVAWLGPGGAGHFVKMAHNSIEYGLMQLLAETYDLLKTLENTQNEELAEIYSAWNDSEELGSFLLEITQHIFRKKENGQYLIDVIRDTAEQKGTGKWAAEAAFEYGVAVPTIVSGVEARILSDDRDLRDRMQKEHWPEEQDPRDVIPPSKQLQSLVRSAYELSMLCTYLQGFELVKKASTEEKWNLPLDEVTRIWQGGCIIRSRILGRFRHMYGANATEARGAWDTLKLRFEGERQLYWRRIVDLGPSKGIPLPAMTSAISWYDAMRRTHLPQNLTQAQRDLFGGHGFERTDQEGIFHAEWI